ncbi:MAG: hypothetical protein K2P99_01955 [Burkholderiales bacterium]|nr:hypothetical protein [Burkholderiales bacterium]
MDKLSNECFQIEFELQKLYILSSKIKQLKLCYIDYCKLLEKIKQEFNAQNEPDTKAFGNEYYAMQIDRYVTEIITRIYSLLDIIEDIKKNNVIKNLIPEFVANMDGLLISELGKRMRNKITHESCNEIKFFTLYIPHLKHKKLYILSNYHKFLQRIIKWNNGFPLYLSTIENFNKGFAEKSYGTILIDTNLQNKIYCYRGQTVELKFKDTLSSEQKDKFISMLLRKLKNESTTPNKNNKIILENTLHQALSEHFVNYNLNEKYMHTWKYVWDEHLLHLQESSILGVNGLNELKERCRSLNISTQDINVNVETPIIILSQQVYQEEITRRVAAIHTPFYDKLLNNIDYKLLTYNTFKKANVDHKIVYPTFELKVDINIADIVSDIYNNYIEYFYNIHAILGNYYSDKINNLIMNSSKLNLKYEDTISKRYSVTLL